MTRSVLRCGGCRTQAALQPVRDKENNSGYLCSGCAARYGALLEPASIRNFWMCGACGFRVLAGTEADASVDVPGNPCPNCRADINSFLVNLNDDRPIGRGLIGEPVD